MDRLTDELSLTSHVRYTRTRESGSYGSRLDGRSETCRHPLAASVPGPRDHATPALRGRAAPSADGPQRRFEPPSASPPRRSRKPVAWLLETAQHRPRSADGCGLEAPSTASRRRSRTPVAWLFAAGSPGLLLPSTHRCWHLFADCLSMSLGQHGQRQVPLRRLCLQRLEPRVRSIVR